MSKVHYLNSHLHKFREKNKITIDVENIGDLAHYSNLYKEDQKTTKIFTKCFKNKESYKELLKKLEKDENLKEDERQSLDEDVDTEAEKIWDTNSLRNTAQNIFNKLSNTWGNYYPNTEEKNLQESFEVSHWSTSKVLFGICIAYFSFGLQQNQSRAFSKTLVS